MTGRMDGKDDHHHRNRTKPRILYIKTELTLKSRKDSTSTLSLVINKGEIQKESSTKVHKSHATTGDETQKTTNFDGFLSFTLSFFFS
jgi:hypothetical protein